MDEGREAVLQILSRTVKKELEDICSEKPTTFRLPREIKEISEISFNDQFKELQNRAPCLSRVITSAAYNERNLARNTVKTKETLTPGIVTASSIILNCRSQRINIITTKNSLILRRGGAKQRAFKRLNAMGICTSYKVAIDTQYKMGQDVDSTVKTWIKEVLQNETKVIDNPHTKNNEDYSKGETAMSDCAPSPDSNTTELRNMETDADLFEGDLIDEDGSFMALALLDNDNELTPDQSVKNSLASDIHAGNEESNHQINVSKQDMIQKQLHPEFEEVCEDVLSPESETNTRIVTPTCTNTKPSINPISNEAKSTETEVAMNSTPLQEDNITGFVVVGDNVDMRNKARNPSKHHGNKDHHFFHILAVKKRIIPGRTSELETPSTGLTDEKIPPTTAFLPSVTDNECLKSEFNILVGRILSKYVPSLSWMTELLPSHIYHKYSKQVAQVSKSVSIYSC